MKAGIEGRLAKLEAGAGIGKGGFIFEVIRADETVEGPSSPDYSALVKA